jgi:hypothetical protein
MQLKSESLPCFTVDHIPMSPSLLCRRGAPELLALKPAQIVRRSLPYFPPHRNSTDPTMTQIGCSTRYIRLVVWTLEVVGRWNKRGLADSSLYSHQGQNLQGGKGEEQTNASRTVRLMMMT